MADTQMMPVRSLLGFAIVTGSLLLAGCVPGFYTSRPEVRGTVVEAETGAPIEHAMVKIRSHPMRYPAVVVFTDKDGSYYLPRYRSFMTWSPYWGKYDWRRTVYANAPGYTESQVELSSFGQMPPKRFDDVRFGMRRGITANDK
jgi:hypothetical protein